MEPHIEAGGLETLIAEVEQMRGDYEAALAQLQATLRAAAHEAAAAGLTARDLGQLLGISYQRAAVLLRESKQLRTT